MANSRAFAEALSIAISVGMVTAPASALAKDPKSAPPNRAIPQLQQALNQSVAASPDVNTLKAMRGDRDQGDEHASGRAKEVVCTKNTPAATRSAICNAKSPN